MRTLILAALLTILPGTAFAAESWCHPNDAGSRVLASANPNDLAKRWTGEAYVGTDWSIRPSKKIRNDDLDFLSGHLFTPRGGDQGTVFILEREWTCGPGALADLGM